MELNAIYIWDFHRHPTKKCLWYYYYISCLLVALKLFPSVVDYEMKALGADFLCVCCSLHRNH